MPETDDKSATDAKAQTEKITALEADVEKWKALSRKNEDRAKENAEAAKEREELKSRLEAIESSKLSDEEKTAKRIADLEASVKAEQDARKVSDLSALKARIGAEKGLPAALISRLQGEDETSIAEDAEALLGVAKTDGFADIGQGQRAAAPLTKDPLEAALRGKLGIAT
jgi:DNA repair ATPase RecN